MKNTRWIQICGLLTLVLLAGACSNRQADDRLIATEVATNTLHADVQDLGQRMQALEERLGALSTEVGSLEIKTLKGAKTSYMVVPAVKATPYVPLTTTTVVPQAATTASVQAQVAASPAQAVPASQAPIASSAALSLPPTSAPMPTQNTPTSAPQPVQTTAVSAPQVAKTAPPAPTTPIPVQAAVSLALPPESSTAVFGQPAQAPAQQAAQATAVVAQSPAKAGVPVSLAPLAPKVKGEEGAYNAALALARGGKTAEAINSFTAFLLQYPTGRYAPNAYYWMGECLYAQRKYTDALLQFKDVAARYPRHHKTADALLKAGMTYDRLGDKENAALQYKALVTDFPTSDAARRVKGRGVGR